MGIFSRFKQSSDDSYMIVGLGNFGDKYTNTRHNAGFIAVEDMAQRHHLSFKRHKCHAAVATGTIDGVKVILVKPLTYMNKSGEAVSALMKFYKLTPDRLVILYDDIDIAEGALRIRPNGSAGTHNGMRSVIACLGYNNFARIRIGVGAPYPGGDLIKHVMGPISDLGREAALYGAKAAEDWAVNGIEHAMNNFNKKAGKA